METPSLPQSLVGPLRVFISGRREHGLFLYLRQFFGSPASYYFVFVVFVVFVVVAVVDEIAAGPRAASRRTSPLVTPRDEKKTNHNSDPFLGNRSRI